MSNQNTEWRWIFSYVLTEKVILPNLSPSPNVKFVTDPAGFVSGFEVGPITSDNDQAPEEYAETRARTIVQLLAAKSEHMISYQLSGYEGIPNDTSRPRRVASISTHSYRIEGPASKIVGVDITDINIENIVASSSKRYSLQYLTEAISNFYSGRYEEGIKRGFMAIEGKTTLNCYYKYKCIRDILNHRKDQIWYPDTVKNFDFYFGSSAFDFEEPYDKAGGIIVLDFKSQKTIQMMKKISHDLITEVKHSLNI